MAEISPLRRRMIEDMTIRNLRLRRSNPTFMRLPSSAAISAALRTGWGWRMCAPTSYI